MGAASAARLPRLEGKGREFTFAAWLKPGNPTSKGEFRVQIALQVPRQARPFRALPYLLDVPARNGGSGQKWGESAHLLQCLTIKIDEGPAATRRTFNVEKRGHADGQPAPRCTATAARWQSTHFRNLKPRGTRNFSFGRRSRFGAGNPNFEWSLRTASEFPAGQPSWLRLTKRIGTTGQKL